MARHGVSRYGPSADVFSFGIVLFEIAARQRPYADQVDLSMYRLLESVANGHRPTVPESESGEVVDGYTNLMASCWSTDATARPSFNAVLLALQGLSPPQ